MVPTILHLISMPVAADFDGVPVPFVAELMQRKGKPIRTIASFESEAAWTGRRPREIGAETYEQLRSLGYAR